MSSKSLNLTYDPTIKKLPNVSNPILMPLVPIKKSGLGIPDKLLLDKLNSILLKCKVLNDTICFYQECIKKLELECASDDDNDNDNDSADGEFLKVV